VKPGKQSGTVRERLLRSANELFYREGIHVIGIDRILSHAAVAKASLYGTFKNKDELVRAYLEDRARAVQTRLGERIAKAPDGRAAILAVFDDFVDRVNGGGYCGCPFIRASAEGEEGPSAAREVSSQFRRWRLGLFTGLAKDAGIENPEELAVQLCLIYDGASVSVAMDGENTAAKVARKTAELLLEGPAASSAPRKKSRRKS